MNETTWHLHEDSQGIQRARLHPATNLCPQKTRVPVLIVPLDAATRHAGIAAASDAFDEWMHRVHGVISSCNHYEEAQAIFDAVIAAITPAPSVEARDDH